MNPAMSFIKSFIRLMLLSGGLLIATTNVASTCEIPGFLKEGSIYMLDGLAYQILKIDATCWIKVRYLQRKPPLVYWKNLNHVEGIREVTDEELKDYK